MRGRLGGGVRDGRWLRAQVVGWFPPLPPRWPSLRDLLALPALIPPCRRPAAAAALPPPSRRCC